jgi:hypothetical protein
MLTNKQRQDYTHLPTIARSVTKDIGMREWFGNEITMECQYCLKVWLLTICDRL